MTRQFSKGEVCEDYEFALHLLALIQAPANSSGANESSTALAQKISACPGTYSGVALAIRKMQEDLHDFHTSFYAPLLRYDSVPVITACQGSLKCDEILGSPLEPMRSEGADAQGQRLYAFAANRELQPKIFEIKSRNGKGFQSLFLDLVHSHLLSMTTSGNYVEAANGILSRHTLDGRERDDAEYTLRDIRDDEMLLVKTSYSPRPSIDTYNLYLALSWGFSSANSYGCVDTENGSTDPRGGIGACLTAENRAIVWMKTLNLTDSKGRQIHPDPSEVAKRLFVRHPEALKQPVILDMRGNGGGFPSVALDFACTFGDKNSDEVLRRRRMKVSMWPKSFRLSSGTVIDTQSHLHLENLSNGDLVKIDEGWTASSERPDGHRRTYDIGLLERLHETPESCQARRDPRFAAVKWVILSNGREFSAAENLLSFLEKSDSKFKQIGNGTLGGTGAPVTIELPRTGMRLRLSVARHVAGDAHFEREIFPIEGKGVSPDNPMMRDLPGEFERRILDFIDGKDIESSAYAPYIMRMAKKVRM